MSFGSSDTNRGGMVLSRYYNPYYQQAMGAGMAAFMLRQPGDQPQPTQYYLPDRRRQTAPEPNLLPPQSPQENDVFYPPLSEKPTTPASQSFDISFPTERTEVPFTTVKAVPELTEPEIEEIDEKPRKRVSKKKQVKKPVHEDDEEDEYPRLPTGAFFPMFFGYGRSGTPGGGPPGPMAIANAYSAARGGVASSHATAYGEPRPEVKYQNQKYQ